MKLNKSAWLAFALLIVVGAFSRLISYNIAGFAPQMAMALFGGAVIKNKKWAFALPLLSLLFSDALLELLFQANVVARAGFYEGQWQVYLCFSLVTLFGFFFKKMNLKNVFAFLIFGFFFVFFTSKFFDLICG